MVGAEGKAMTDEEKTMVAALNARLMAHCACQCDADGVVFADEMCLDHRTMIADARAAEREACASIADVSATKDRKNAASWGDRDNTLGDCAITAEAIAKRIRERI